MSPWCEVDLFVARCTNQEERRYLCQKYKENMERPVGRGLHSSTSQLNLSRFWSLMPQLPSTSQLNLKRFLVHETPQIAHEKCSHPAEKWTRVVHEKSLC